jgi:hypothetical protein
VRPAGSTGHPAPPSGCPSSWGPDGVKTAPKRQELSGIGADSDRELPPPNSYHGAEPRDHLKAGLTRHPLARRKHLASGVAPTRRPRAKFCLYRSVAMLSGRATACLDCRQSTVSCAGHLTRLTRHHVTLSRPGRFRWQPVRPRWCSGRGQLPSHRPGGATACWVRRQCAGDTGVLPSQRTRCSSYPVGDCDLRAGQIDLLATFSALHCTVACVPHPVPRSTE